MSNCDFEIPESLYCFPKLTLKLYSNSILHIKINSEVELSISDLPPILEYIDALQKGPFLNLFEFDNYSSTDKEVRDWASDPNGNKRTVADAIVIKGLDQKILADGYLNNYKLTKPTRLFNNTETAKKWLLSLSK